MSTINVITTFLVLFNLQNFVSASVKILGGYDCNLKEFPFVVTIHSGGVCGGSLITFRWVLTAAHCVHIDHVKAESTRVRSGFNGTDPEEIQERIAKYAVVHKKYAEFALKLQFPAELRYDIALVLVDKPFTKSETVGLLQLPKPGQAFKCKMGTALGIGREEISFKMRSFPLKGNSSRRYRRGLLERTLKCVDLTIVQANDCGDSYPGSTVEDKTLICTKEHNWGKDACQGDSGGPLLCFETKIIIGIISYGHGCGIADRSATYTKVEYYLDFINDTIHKKSYTWPPDQTEEPWDRSKADRNKKWLCSVYYLLVLTFFML